MSFTDEDKSVIRDVIADFLTKRKLQTKEMCDEKMDNVEATVKSINVKLWAIILLLFGSLVNIIVQGFAG